jgi:predicted small secreted protein
MRALTASPAGQAAALLVPALIAVLLAACASTGGAGDDPTAALQGADVRTRTVENGDVIEEYRIAGQLRAVKVTPSRGPTYYLVDNDGDGRLDSSKGEGTVSPVYYKLFSW